jgi:Zn-dependent protease/predicted transcriptional regulator
VIRVTGHSWRAGRIAGIEVRIDSSWAVIAALITYSLYAEFSLAYRSLSGGAAGLLAAAAAFLFFGSVLTHELVHAVVARRRGMDVSGITLFLFGGATHADVEGKRPWDEFVVSILGPLASAMLSLTFAGVAAGLGQVRTDPVAGALGYLAWVNLMLAGFNLLPGLPLDGGRVLRSIVWRATGSPRRATRAASLTGEVMGYLLILGGLLLLFSGALGSGLWLAAIGWFLSQSAKASYMDVEARVLLHDVNADDVMERGVTFISPDASVEEAVEEFLRHPDHDTFCVTGSGRVLGYITLAMSRRVPREQWRQRTVREVMAEFRSPSAVMPHTPMNEVLSLFESGETACLLVVDHGTIVGLITSFDVVHSLQRRRLVAA